MSNHRVKFAFLTRTIDPKTQIHYLDAIDEEGRHWVATLDGNRRRTGENHPCYTKNGQWRPSFTHPWEES